MTGGVLSDILRGFAGQLRRSPWGVALLWVGLVIATVAVVMGFSLARSVSARLGAWLPGELERLYYADVTAAVQPGAERVAQTGVLWAEPVVHAGFSVAMMEELMRSGAIDGYFIPVACHQVGLPPEGEGRVNAALTAYGGRPPLFGGRVEAALAQAAARSDGIILNRTLAAELGGVRPGDMVMTGPDEVRQVVALVGPEAGLDPQPRVVLPVSAAPEGFQFGRVALYLPPGAGPEQVASWLTEALRQVEPNAEVRLTSGWTEHGRDIREAQMVATAASGIAVLIAAVAFVNAGSFATVWVLNRRRGLALRRALGATPGLVALYVTADLALIALSALAAGLLLVMALSAAWLRPLGIPAVSLPGLLGATAFMLVATALLGWVLTRTVSRSEPGALLGRVL